MTDHQAYALWKALYVRCRGKGLSHSDAEDLASDALHKALAGYDESRGKLVHFCNRILSNLIVDHFRSRKIAIEVPETIADEEIDIEKEIDVEKKLSLVLNLDLTDAEREFLTTYGAVLEELGDRAVSETARRLGMNSEEGWNLLRKIQRKAERLEVTKGPKPESSKISGEERVFMRLPLARRKGLPIDVRDRNDIVSMNINYDATGLENIAKEWFLFSAFSRFRDGLRVEERRMLGVEKIN